MKILALLDGRPGNDNQTIAIAEQLGEYESLKVEFGCLAKLPSFLLGRSLLGVKTKIEQKPYIVIATGRKLARVAAHLKAQHNCKAIQLMYPHMKRSWFDLIFVPEHDGKKPRKNLYTTIGAPNRIDDALLNAQEWKFIENLTVALVGDVEEKEVRALRKISDLHITTSRRTKPETVKALRALKPKYMFEWHEDAENPYYGLLASAENIIVSADSVGMISEACTTGKRVYFFGKTQKRKFKKFIKGLKKQGYLRKLKEFGKEWQPERLSTRDSVVRIIKNYIET